MWYATLDARENNSREEATPMTTQSNAVDTWPLYDAAEARVRELFPTDTPADRWAREFAMTDWSPEHWAWLIEADEAEIRDWVGEMPTAEDRPDLYEEETTMMDTTSRMTPEERAEVLAVIVTRDGAGRHFTEVWDWDTLNELEEAGLIYIDRPIHEPTGIPYSEEYYSVTVTEAGQELVDAYEADS